MYVKKRIYQPLFTRWQILRETEPHSTLIITNLQIKDDRFYLFYNL